MEAMSIFALVSGGLSRDAILSRIDIGAWEHCQAVEL